MAMIIIGGVLLAIGLFADAISIIGFLVYLISPIWSLVGYLSPSNIFDEIKLIISLFIVSLENGYGDSLLKGYFAVLGADFGNYAWTIVLFCFGTIIAAGGAALLTVGLIKMIKKKKAAKAALAASAPVVDALPEEIK